jgi:Fe-S cluster assembly protein SufD
MNAKLKQLTELATPFIEVADQTVLQEAEPEWLKQLRQAAKQQFEQAGLPAKKVEDWKYTSLWDLAQQQFVHQADTKALTVAEVTKSTLLDDDDAYRLVLIDGVFKADYSTVTELEDGLTIKPLSAASEVLQSQLGQHIDINKPGLNALNTRLMSQGVVIEVDAEHKVSKPIELVHIHTGSTDHLAAHLRHLVVLKQGSQAEFIEHYVGLDNSVALTNVVTELSLAENAQLTHYKLQQESDSAFHIATLAAKQAANSQWHNYNICLGAGLARNDIHSQLLGQQAHVTMDGLYLLSGNQHADNHTHIDHAVPNTTSSELYKGVLDENSHAVFNGKVMVHKDAQHTDANQKNHNLLLSRGCEIDTKPEMEIYADDVKCGHGSTVGQINEDQLFFLRARGLDETTARSLLTFAFAAEVLANIQSEQVKTAMTNVIEQRLPRGV